MEQNHSCYKNFYTSNVTDITQQSGMFSVDHVKFNTGFQIMYLLTVFNIKPRLPFLVRNNALN